MSPSHISTNKKTESLFLVVVMLLVFGMATITPTDTDMWWHLRAGDEMAHQGKILLEDTFSYTRAGAPWVNAFWLSDIGLYGLWKLGGFFAITIAVALIAAALMSIIYLHMDGWVYLRGLLILLAMIGIHPNWSARPQLMSFLLLAFLDYFLARHRRFKRQPLWIMILIFALWGNLHGGFIWGILLLVAVIVGEGLDNLLDNQPDLSWKEIGALTFWSILAGLAVSINPNGISLWRLPFDQVQVSLSIAEWLSPDFHQFYAHPLLWLLFLLIISLAYSGKRISFADLLKGLGFTYLFFVAQRNMGPFVIILLPIIARNLTPAIQSFLKAPIIESIINKIAQMPRNKQPSQKVNFIVNTILVSLLTVFAIFNAYLVSTPQRMDEKLPSRAVQWIKDNHPRGPIFNSYNWGGYLTWELRDYPVFIDGRADLYGTKIISQWQDVVYAREDAISILNAWDANIVLLEPNWPIIPLLEKDGWEILYRDKISVLLSRP
jgi:hypothetical protein